MSAGLQAERTGLAWSRTSLAVTGNAVLLVVRQLGHAEWTAPLIVAVALAGVIAVGTVLYGWRRTARLRVSPSAPGSPRWAVPVLGWSVVVLAVLSGVAVVL